MFQRKNCWGVVANTPPLVPEGLKCQILLMFSDLTHDLGRYFTILPTAKRNFHISGSYFELVQDESVSDCNVHVNCFASAKEFFPHSELKVLNDLPQRLHVKL